MKKLVNLFAIAALFMASCGGPAPKEMRSEALDISITIPSEKPLKDIEAGQYTLAQSEFYIDKSRFVIKEIEEAKMPSDLNMLAEAVQGMTGFKSILEKKEFPNGAIGLVYEDAKGKHLMCYFKKANRVYRMTEVFNSEGKNFDKAMEAFGTIK